MKILKRMLSVLLIPMLTQTTFAADALAPKEWQVVRRESAIAFRARQAGAEFKGSFGLFAPRISFSPDNLAASKAVVDITLSSVDTRSADRDENLKGKDWFDVARFPSARFETTAFRKTGEKTYEADARLTIRDVALPVTLPFKLDIVKDSSGKETATMDGSVTLDRSKFNIGSGSWVDTGIIANEVPVDVHIVAVHRGAEKPMPAPSK
ncbi:MAG: YceI family protein [Pseudomonadota bacterium]